MKKFLALVITSLFLTGCGDSMDIVTWNLAKDLCIPFGGVRSAGVSIQINGNRVIKAYCTDKQVVEKFYSGEVISKLRSNGQNARNEK